MAYISVKITLSCLRIFIENLLISGDLCLTVPLFLMISYLVASMVPMCSKEPK